MNSKIFKYIKQQILLLICCFSFVSYAQSLKLSDNAQISVLTCGSGDEMYSIFGHTAIRVTDDLNGLDVVYNYGMFDFSTPNFYSKFIKGDLLYSIGQENYNDFIAAYKYYNRSINEQYLNLTLNQKQAIFDKIQHQLNSEERDYQYKFIENNCTTKVVNLLDNVLEKPLEHDFEGNADSQRIILNSFLKNHYFEKLGINLLFGINVDKDNQKVFLPEKLMHSISKTTNGNQKLEQNNLLHYEKIEDSSKTNWNTIYFFSIICLILAFLSRLKFMQYFIFFLIGILGTVILVVSLFTNHSELVWNESLLLFNPLYFFLALKKFRSIIVKILWASIVLFLIIASFEKVLIVLPLLLLEICYLFQLFRKKN
ncbi:DUF4105 domain-containing protein [Flavobacterium sp. I3-2]|uniref:lipoprotein N-acyltransferase Lnb domain-containing protein n=1 Tax=Flavobacterium sp. I3-2 TaxID=2748319 RepID=UPI0015A844FE|nr:DUF4105 domain-containing protein [Flavobacterium sp. I3-2]